VAAGVLESMASKTTILAIMIFFYAAVIFFVGLYGYNLYETSPMIGSALENSGTKDFKLFGLIKIPAGELLGYVLIGFSQLGWLNALLFTPLLLIGGWIIVSSFVPTINAGG
jgi:hypothetical protein